MMSITDQTPKLWVWGNNQYGQLGVSLARVDNED
jgi:alpha-tubulin suppressor-like RCC1 family protein